MPANDPRTWILTGSSENYAATARLAVSRIWPGTCDPCPGRFEIEMDRMQAAAGVAA
jgi:hypothetical protein